MGDRHLTCRACRVIERTKRLSRTDSTHKMGCPLRPCPPVACREALHPGRTALKCNQVELKEQAGDSHALICLCAFAPPLSCNEGVKLVPRFRWFDEAEVAPDIRGLPAPEAGGRDGARGKRRI